MILQAKNILKENFFPPVSLDILEGEIINIVSKDSKALDALSKSLIGLIKVKGEIKLFDHDIKQTLPKVLNFVGYTSSLKYKSNESVYKYLSLTSKFYKINLDDRIEYLLQQFEIDKNKMMKDLDIYEQKNVSIIKAILHNPKFVILNNIVDSLDSKSSTILEDIMLSMKKEGTSFLITSDKLALNIIDKVYILDKCIKEYDKLKNIYKIEFTNVSSFNYNSIKNVSLTNLNIGTKTISFIISDNLCDTIKYICQLRPSFLTIKRPYIGEIVYENIFVEEWN